MLSQNDPVEVKKISKWGGFEKWLYKVKNHVDVGKLSETNKLRGQEWENLQIMNKRASLFIRHLRVCYAGISFLGYL